MAVTITHQLVPVSTYAAQTTTGPASNVDYARLPDGRDAVVYQVGSEVRLTMRDGLGGTPVTITLAGQSDPSIAVLSTGELLVVARNSSGGLTHTRLDATGAVLGSSTITSIAPVTQLDAEVVALNNGGYAILRDSTDANFPSLRLSFHDNAGAQTGQFSFDITFRSMGQPEIARLADGNLALTYQRSSGSSGTQTVIHVISPTGQQVLAPTVISAGFGAQPAITAFGANMAVTYELPDGSIRVGVFSTSGVQVSTFDIQPPNTGVTFARPQITVAPGGLLAIAVETNSGQPSLFIANQSGVLVTRAGLPAVSAGELSLGVDAHGRILVVGSGDTGAQIREVDFSRRVQGDGSADVWVAGDDLGSNVFGGGGNDRLTGSSANDTLRGEDGDDILNGGAGDDVLVGGVGADMLTGGEGRDRVSYSGSAGGVVVNLASGGSGNDAAGDTYVSIEDAEGSAFADILQGTADANRLTGLAGNDLLIGFAGADELIGGDGDDTLIPGADTDADIIDGGAGIDIVHYDTATSGILLRLDGSVSGGGAVGDRVTNVENVLGSGFADDIIGNGAANTLHGQGGDDFLQGQGGDDVLFGGAGIDVLEGGDGNDTLVGNADIFAEQRDTLRGGLGNDLIYGERADIIDGGTGFDSLIAINAYDWSLDMAATSIEYAVMDFGNDTVTAANQTVGVSIFTSGGNDTVTGSAFDDLIFGGVGDDVILGGDGNDAIVGEAGADRLDGGAGDDRIYFDAQDTFVFGGTGYDAGYITPGAGGGATVNMGASSLEFLQDLAGQSDTILGSTATVGLSIYAGGGNDIAEGSAFDDVIWGEAGDDILSGNAGADVLVGGAGSDRLSGGAGVDRLYAGANDGVRDTFVFQHAGLTHADFVYEFERANDRIDLSAFGGAAFANVALVVSGGNSIVSLNGQRICVVVGVTNLTEANFVFAAGAAPDPSAAPVPLVQPALEEAWTPSPLDAVHDSSVRPSWLPGAGVHDYTFLA